MQTEIFDLPTLWQNINDLPTIRQVEADFGTDKTLGLITVKINKMIEGLPLQLDKPGMKKLTMFIHKEYKHLRFAEFDIIGLNLLREKLYGKTSINTISRAIDKYWLLIAPSWN